MLVECFTGDRLIAACVGMAQEADIRENKKRKRGEQKDQNVRSFEKKVKLNPELIIQLFSLISLIYSLRHEICETTVTSTQFHIFTFKMQDCKTPFCVWSKKESKNGEYEWTSLNGDFMKKVLRKLPDLLEEEIYGTLIVLWKVCQKNNYYIDSLSFQCKI